MTLDLTDPASIVAWYRVAPGRHGPVLVVFARLAPQFREHIKRAGDLIRAAKQERK
jgi:hypothetical protein